MCILINLAYAKFGVSNLIFQTVILDKPLGGRLEPLPLAKGRVNLTGKVWEVELISTFRTAVCESWNVSDKYTWDNVEDLKQLSMDQTLSEHNRSD